MVHILQLRQSPVERGGSWRRRSACCFSMFVSRLLFVYRTVKNGAVSMTGLSGGYAFRQASDFSKPKK